MIKQSELRDQVINLQFEERRYSRWSEKDKAMIDAVDQAIVVELTIPRNALIKLCENARHNKTGRATDGGIVAKVRR